MRFQQRTRASPAFPPAGPRRTRPPLAGPARGGYRSTQAWPRQEPRRRPLGPV